MGKLKLTKVTPENFKFQDLNKLLPILLKFLTVLDYNIFTKYMIVSTFLHIIAIMGLIIASVVVLTCDFWLHCGFFILLFTPLTLQALCALKSYKGWKALREHFATKFSWKLQFLPLKIKREITTLSRRLDIIFFCLLVVIHTVLQIAYQIQLGPEVMHFTRLYGISDLVTLIIIITVSFGITCVAAYVLLVPYSVIYFITLIRLQLIILHSMIKGFSENMPPSYSPFHRKYVREGLRALTNRHRNIVRAHTYLRQWALWPLIISSLSILSIMSFQAILLLSPNYDIKLSLWTYMEVIMFLSLLCHYGQSYENISENIGLALLDLKWYEWDRISIDMYRVFLINASLPFRTNQTITFLQMNHFYFSKILTIGYAMINWSQVVYDNKEEDISSTLLSQLDF